MRKKILAANWKMNLSATEAQEWITQFKSGVSDQQLVEFRLYAPNVFIHHLSEDEDMHVGAQNVHPADFGAFTGEIAIPQLKSVGAQSVLIGHSERRTYFQESDSFLKEKVDACCAHLFPFIFCCGENLETREGGNHLSFVQKQVENSIFQLNPQEVFLMTIAYEPIWAIGTGLTATTDQINEVHAFIRTILTDKFGETGANVSILYGGSVNEGNAQGIFSCPDVDGGLRGGSSLNAFDFLELASSF